MIWEYLKDNFHIGENTIDICSTSYLDIQKYIQIHKQISYINQLKVMKSFQKFNLCETHFYPTTGYGYDDVGRDTIDDIYADIFHCEDALVRHNFANGTHTISTALYGVLRPGDELIAVTGKPYDTLEEAIGIIGDDDNGSLKDFGVTYKQVDLVDGMVDYNNIMSTVTKNTKAILIQKSKGYDWRPSLSCEEIGKIVATVKKISEKIICIVDNCYGEFVETTEPTDFGADLVCGSLIKNIGGGLVSCGGYIAGKKRYVEQASYRLNSVGLGKHVGASVGFNKQILQGLFFAPHIVHQALCTAMFAGSVYEKVGLEVNPKPSDTRVDIIQSIKFGTEEGVIKFCQGIQKGSPIDSFVMPRPWEMPGYSHQVIMAAGAFTQGASIELSADAPIKEPYVAYMQGGLTFESGILGVALSLENYLNGKVVE